MADKVIAATLKLNTGSSVQDVEAVNKSLAGTTAVLGGTNEQAKTTKGSFDTLKDGLGKLPGPLKSVAGGVDTVQTSLKALAANPIVLVVTLLVAALYGLYKAFTSTEEGAEKVSQILSGIGAVITVIRDRVLALAGAVVDFFEGNFTKAAHEAAAAVTGVGDAAVAAYGRAAQAQKEFQEVTDRANRETAVSRAQLNKDLAASRELINDETASYSDRVKAINDVREAQTKQAAKELKDASDLLDVAKTNLDLDQKSADKRDEFAKATINLLNVQQQAAADLRAINKQDHQIEAGESAKSNAAAKAAHEEKMQQLAAEKAALAEQTKQIQASTQAWLEYVKQGTSFREQQRAEQQKQDEADQKARDEYQKKEDAKELSAFDKLLKDKLAKDKAAADAEKKIEQLKIDTKQKALEVTSGLFAAAANLAGKGSAAGKAFAIAGATIDTYRGALAAFTGMTSSIPGPVGIALGIAAAAAAVANGIATVKQIVSVKIPGGQDAGGTTPAGVNFTAPAAPVAPTQTGTAIDQNSINGIGNAVSGRSYVLSQDVTHDQDRNERLNRSARLGG